MVRPGTIGHALAQADETQVYLDAVWVEKIKAHQNPVYFVVRECFDRNARMIVYTPPSPELRLGQTVDVQGTLTTLWNRERALVEVTVFGYLDKNGKLLYHGPLVKGLLEPTPWQWKVDLTVPSASGTGAALSDVPPAPGEPSASLPDPPTYYATIADLLAANPPDGTAVGLQCKPIASTGSDPTYGSYFVTGEDSGPETLKTYCSCAVNTTDRVNNVTGQIRTEGTNRALCVDGGPGYDPEGYVGNAQTAAEGTIAWAKTFADGAALTADLNDKVVSREFPGLGCFYIQAPGGEAGIRVNNESLAMRVSPGDVVSIPSDRYAWPAVMSTRDGERVIDPTWMITGIPVDAPRPLGINNRGIGGGAFNVYTSGAVGASGLNNVGLLIRTWGKVISTSQDWFYLDDGSALSDGTGTTGVRVTGAYGYMPDVNDCVAVTGVGGLATLATDLARVLRLTSSSDITSVSVTPHPVNPVAISTGSGKISVYWDGVPGATGYNVYRGLASGGENYASPVNGSTPITAPTYTGGNVYMFTDTGLTNGTEYFHTVKAIGPLGLSNPSAEVSEIPSAYAIPWDSGDVYAITSAIQSHFYVVFDYIRAAGPDGRIYDSWQSEPLPPDGTIIPGTNLLQLPDGSQVPLPNEAGQFEYGGGGTGAVNAPPPPKASDGPYRKVETEHTYFTEGQQSHYLAGAQGTFYLPDRNAIRLGGSRDALYTYLGGANPGGSTDAGVLWGRDSFSWLATQATHLKGGAYSTKHIANYARRGLRNFTPGTSVAMAYIMVPSASSTYVIVQGWNLLWEDQLICLGNAYPAKYSSAQIKRVHSIALGRPPDTYRKTNSHIWGEEAHSMQLIDTGTSAWNWTATRNGTNGVDGCYPPPSTGIVTWNPVSPFTDETQINLSTESTWP